MTSGSFLIERLALGGDGVARRKTIPPSEEGGGGQVVFVPYTAPGDRVVLGSLREENSFARGWVTSISVPSPQRREPPCSLFFRPGRGPLDVCGGCDWQHLNDLSQREGKRALLIETLQRVGKIAKPAVEETLAGVLPESSWRYRNKGLVPFAQDARGRLVAGFYAPGSHTVVPLEVCPVQDERFERAVRVVREWLDQRKVRVYDGKTETGWLRHLLVRTASTGETLLALVTTSADGADVGALARDVKKNYPFVTSFFQNINDRPGNVVLGPRWRHVSGKTHLEEELLGLRFRLSPGAFFQVNRAMAEKLYTVAIEMAQVEPTDTVWELYAGVGAMGQLLARKARRVWAVEENSQAVRDGIESVRRNAIANLRFRQGRCEEVLARARGNEAPQIVLLDPPRAGCDRRVLKSVLKAAPRRIVYLSCDPATLARDARYLSTGNYPLIRSVPVDLFPQTSHIESVTLFERAAR